MKRRRARQRRDSETRDAAEPVALDVSNPDSIATAFGQVRERHGRCDVVVNNAGIAKTFPFVDFPLENFVATMKVNVTGTLLCAQHRLG